MRVEISGRNYEVTEKIRALFEKKFGKVTRYFVDVIEARCVLRTEKYHSVCEVYVIGKDYDVKSIQKADTMEEAITSTIDHLKRQAKKNRSRITERRKKTGSAVKSPSSWLVQVLEPGRLRERPKVPRIVKTSRLPIRPMSIEEAALKLDDSRNDFIVFRDLDTDKVTVIYRRQDNNFGMIAPEV